jgi:hypothetical protein
MTTTLNASTAGAGGFIATGDNSGSLALQTAGTTAVTIDTSQNVGIGTTSPSAKMDVAGSAYVRGDSTNATFTSAGVFAIKRSTGDPYMSFHGNTGSRIGYLQMQDSGICNLSVEVNQPLAFQTNGTERMRIDSSGNVGVGTTSPATNFHVVGQIRTSGSTAQTIYVYGAAGVKPYITINEYGVRSWDVGAGYYSSGTFSIQSGGVNGVYLGATAVAWASASDERIKDIIEPIDNALAKVNGLRSVIGKYKTDEEGVRRSFLIAQDIQTQFPEALESSNSERLGVQYTDVIPLLVASIKELKAINDQQAETINALTARIVALESK